MSSLAGRRILITGASKGIGRAFARVAAERGARLALNARAGERLDRVADELEAVPLAADLGEQDAAEALVPRAVEALGGLDVLINNAARPGRARLEDIRAEEMEAVWRLNVLAPTLLAREAARAFRARGEGSGGDVMNVASTAAWRGYEGGSAYAASKFALRALGECWRAELRRENVRVFTVSPSEVQTAFGRGEDPEQIRSNKLVAEDVAHAMVAALECEGRAFWPEVILHATNPW